MHHSALRLQRPDQTSGHQGAEARLLDEVGVMQSRQVLECDFGAVRQAEGDGAIEDRLAGKCICNLVGGITLEVDLDKRGIKVTLYQLATAGLAVDEREHNGAIASRYGGVARGGDKGVGATAAVNGVIAGTGDQGVVA